MSEQYESSEPELASRVVLAMAPGRDDDVDDEEYEDDLEESGLADAFADPEELDEEDEEDEDDDEEDDEDDEDEDDLDDLDDDLDDELDDDFDDLDDDEGPVEDDDEV